MAMTAVGGDFDRPAGVPGCWCCGDRTVTASLLRLGEHPEVGVCFRCVRVLARPKRELERQTRAAPIGWRGLQHSIDRVEDLLVELHDPAASAAPGSVR